MATVKVTDKLIKQLEEQGFKVTPVKRTIAKSFQIELDALEEFMNVQKHSGLGIGEAASEALRDWAKKNR